MEFLDRLAAETGYLPTPLEKVSRLGEMAAGIARHPFLKESLVLKGGTALNLCFGAPQRLSVDLDYNYIGFAGREGMLKNRPEVESAVKELAKRYGYRAQVSADTFAGRKIYLTYRSAYGQDARIEVDLNFLFRIPLFKVHEFPLWQPPGLDRPLVKVVSMEELLVGKFLALLERGASRDVWDVSNLPEFANAVIESSFFRALFVAFSITLEHPLATYGQKNFRRGMEADGIMLHLIPMLMKGTKVTADELIEKAWNRVKGFFVHRENESAFFSWVAQGQLRLDLLFPDDPEYAGRIASHPALLWKITNIRSRNNLINKSNVISKG